MIILMFMFLFSVRLCLLTVDTAIYKTIIISIVLALRGVLIRRHENSYFQANIMFSLLFDKTCRLINGPLNKHLRCGSLSWMAWLNMLPVLPKISAFRRGKIGWQPTFQVKLKYICVRRLM